MFLDLAMEFPLKNKYWVLRPGRSIPDELEVVVSHLSNGVLPRYGLSRQGILQAKAAGELFLREVKSTGLTKVCICSSPFSQTIQTSECALDVLDAEYGSPQIHVLDELRERYFGPRHELKSRLDYTHDDALDPLVGPDGGESVMDVAERVLKVIPRVESQVQGYAVLIVGHGDVLQILQAIVQHQLNSSEKYEKSCASNLSQHKKFELLNGELRRLA